MTLIPSPLASSVFSLVDPEVWGLEGEKRGVLGIKGGKKGVFGGHWEGGSWVCFSAYLEYGGIRKEDRGSKQRKRKRGVLVILRGVYLC